MDIFFVNLADRQDRRDAVESNFADCAPAQWRLHRVDGVPAQEAAARPGPLTDREKGCFLGHVAALAAAKSAPGHVLIAEDDIFLGRNSAAMIESALARIPEQGWDLVYTDICVSSTAFMLDLFRLRGKFSQNYPYELINLAGLPFAGATAYIVNKNSRERLASQLAAAASFDIPYDLYLRKLIYEKTLRGFALFPFATTLSALGDQSQIQISAAGPDLVWNEFRRLVWAERDAEAVLKRVAHITADAPDQQAFLKILIPMLNPEFGKK